MYEIWLVLNILWELALQARVPLVAAVVVWVVFVLAALRRPASNWRRALPMALVVGALVAVVAVLLVPGWTRSGLSEMGYWVDWANLLAIALGLGGAAFAWAWPARTLLLPRRALPAR